MALAAAWPSPSVECEPDGLLATALRPASPRLDQERIATPETTSVNGLAVTAVNRRQHPGSRRRRRHVGTVDALNVSGSVAVIDQPHRRLHRHRCESSTRATRARRARSRCWSPPATTRRSWASPSRRRSRASGLTPGVVVLVINNTTTASIDDGASVTAAGQHRGLGTFQRRHPHDRRRGAVAGEAALGGSVAYVGVNDTTQANIGDTATSERTVPRRTPAGNVLVDATDDTVAYMITGSLAVGSARRASAARSASSTLSKNTECVHRQQRDGQCPGQHAQPLGNLRWKL